MSELTINTTQNVNINFNAAAIGDRILAYLIDLSIKIAYVIVIGTVFFYWLQLANIFKNMDQWSVAAVLIVFYFPVMVYSITLESIMEGQTFGKKIMKIKVVKIDGYQASFGDYLIRWFFRIIDISILNGIIAIVAIVTSDKSQRLGDMTAGTAVITIRNKVTISSTILEDLGSDYLPTYASVIKLSDNDVRIIKETFQTAKSKGDFETMVRLRKKIETVTGISSQSDTDAHFISTIMKDYNFYTQNM